MKSYNIEIYQFNKADGGDFAISISDKFDKHLFTGYGKNPEDAWISLMDIMKNKYPWENEEPECWCNGYSYLKIVDNEFKWIRVYDGMQQTGKSYSINMPMRNFIIGCLGEEKGNNVFKYSNISNFFIRNFFIVGIDKTIEDLIEFYDSHKKIFEE